MLNDSVIYCFVIKIKNIIVCYFINSGLYNAFLKIGFTFKAAKEESFLLSAYNKVKKIFSASWLSSVTAKGIGSIFKLANLISYQKHTADKQQSYDGKCRIKNAENNSYIDGSKAVSIVDSLFKGLICIDTCTVGLLLFAFSSTGLILQFTLKKYGNMFTLFELFLFAMSIILILIGRPLLSLYEGSWIAKRFAGFFKVRNL